MIFFTIFHRFFIIRSKILFLHKNSTSNFKYEKYPKSLKFCVILSVVSFELNCCYKVEDYIFLSVIYTKSWFSQSVQQQRSKKGARVTRLMQFILLKTVSQRLLKLSIEVKSDLTGESRSKN